MLGAVRQQAITWANVDPDLWRHIVWLGQNELMVILGVNLPDSSNITQSVTPRMAAHASAAFNPSDWLSSKGTESGNPRNTRGLPLVCNTPVV